MGPTAGHACQPGRRGSGGASARLTAPALVLGMSTEGADRTQAAGRGDNGCPLSADVPAPCPELSRASAPPVLLASPSPGPRPRPARSASSHLSPSASFLRVWSSPLQRELCEGGDLFYCFIPNTRVSLGVMCVFVFFFNLYFLMEAFF